jgi:hypothetical protein
MGYYYEEERRVREAIEKLIICSGQINDVYRLYEEMFGENDLDGSVQLVEEISVFFESVKENYKQRSARTTRELIL